MSRKIFPFTLCTVNQWALDFKGNFQRIKNCIEKSKRLGSKYCLFPELSITSYGCEDHFLEPDTTLHSWEVVSSLLLEMKTNENFQNIICDIGAPVYHHKKIYNCRLILLNSEILMIRPKMVLPDGGLHRESRWFHPWNRKDYEYFDIPKFVRNNTQSNTARVPFGYFLINFPANNLTIGLETCEELWSENSLNEEMYENGAQIIMNASASHHEIRKLEKRVELVCNATKSRNGCYYAYSNLIGCDAQRIAYDGSSMVSVNGQLLHIEKQFSLKECLVTKIEMNLKTVENQKIKSEINLIDIDFDISSDSSSENPLIYQDFGMTPEREVALMPSLWLWDILRRTNSGGFFLCLSGGIDSASVAMIIYNLCKENNESIKEQVYNICQFPENFRIKSERDICNKILTTCYMKTNNNSTKTEELSKSIAENIGSRHLQVSIDKICESFMETAMRTLDVKEPPKFLTQGGSKKESLILQNPQARSRMALAYLFAQMIPWKDNLKRDKLILGSSNLDETLRGYLTKYDCSSSDLNPIGSISKEDIRLFIKNEIEISKSEGNHELSKTLVDILGMKPSAELEPPNETGEIQSDEIDMGLTYRQLSLFGRLRKESKLGPYLMFREILYNGKFSKEIFPDAPDKRDLQFAQYLGDKIKLFFRFYAINRHKTTILTPAYHAEAYNADDNRFDLRPFIYPINFDFQFSKIDQLIMDYNREIST